MYENRDLWLSSSDIADVFDVAAKHVRTFMKPLLACGRVEHKMSESRALWRWREPDPIDALLRKFMQQGARSTHNNQRSARAA